MPILNSRLRSLCVVLPLCLGLAGCGNSISPSSTPGATGVTVTISSSSTTCATGGLVTLTATVTNASGDTFTAPTGDVEFYGNGTDLGSGQIATTSANAYSTTYNLVEPCGGFTVSNGQNSVTAKFQGDSTHSAATSTNSIIITVGSGGGTGGSGNATTTSTPTANPTSITLNQVTVLTATVSATAGGAPTGVVYFLDSSNNNTSVGSSPLNPVGTTACPSISCTSASASVTGTTLGAGSHKIIASYQPNASTYNASVSTGSVTVTVTSGGGGTASSSTSLTASASTVTSSETTTLTATITGGTTTPTGTVTFYDQTTSQNLGTAVSVVAGATAGTATATASPSGSSLASGANIIVAQYSGDTFYAGSDSASVTVTLSGTGGTGGGSGIATTITSNPTTVALTFGGTCTNIAITVQGAPGNNPAITPQGNVTVSADGILLGSPNLGGYDGVSNTGWKLCSANDTPLGANGTYNVELSYPGDNNYAPSTTVVPTTVTGGGKAQVSLQLSATSASTIAQGSCATLEATLQLDAEPNNSYPTGTVMFTASGPATGSGSGTVVESNGVATSTFSFCTAANQAKGTYTVNAIYDGDTNYNASSESNGVTIIVN